MDELKDTSSEEEDSDDYDYYDSIICFRCGREGHYAITCFAKKHINGYYLTLQAPHW